ncbi:ketopantoate reductase family protein [Rhodophyticola sp. CCM32]|uniref:ketopantoate reductase family protein n=1 Tax=Rhodophyticola sp. CCM32 TaxID=2916397 RepID=UPI00107FA7ED|nr:2-dehydropantoate 2-reductase N-terminal domain-containing protein [Rhodophyticola sp. CCM32]QBY02403.1 ketopantoate reductase family protein [Rhodophyticola sp. CCM32]
MRVVIYGVGAVGGVIGAALAHAGHPVIGIARGRQLEALCAGPLRMRHPGGEVNVTLPCVEDPAQITFRADDVILLTMKTQDTGPALTRLRAAGGRDQAIFCLQNGIANERMALRLFPNVHGVTVMMPAGFTEPGEVTGHGTPKLGLFDIGRYPQGSDAADATLAALFDSAEMAGFVHSDVMASKRGKLLMNIGNVLEAGLGQGVDKGAFMARAKAEAIAAFKAAGLGWDDVGMQNPRRAALMQTGKISGTDRLGGSTTQSLLRGTGAVETDYLNGEVVLIARQQGIPAPVNSFLCDLGAEMAARNTQPGSLSEDRLHRLFAVWEAGGDVSLPGS